MSGYLELSFELGELSADAAESACFEQGAASVTFSDSRDDPVLEPLPGEFRLWPATQVQALFDGSADADALIRILTAALHLAPGIIRMRPIEDRVWEREWLKHFSAMRFGRRLWICPHHETIGDPDAVVVSLDPGLAFGTGTHPSTRLCLEWLDGNLAPDAQPRVIDYGCGSGVLALAAVKLGAQSADCFDIDPQALLATKDNAEDNGVADRVHIHSAAQTLPVGADVLLANILSGPLCELAPRFASLVRSGGYVVLAGLMEHEAADVTRAYAPCFDMYPFGHGDGWVGLCGRRH